MPHAKEHPVNENAATLIADIGGTHARFAMAQKSGLIEDLQVFSCRDFPGPAAAAETYLSRRADKTPPERGIFAIACPIKSDRIEMTNHAWSFSIDETKQKLGLRKLQAVNDFSAIALSVPYLKDEDLLPIGNGTPVSGSPIVILGPGTGLGVSALISMEGRYLPLATEGGHATMAAVTKREASVLELLRQDGHVSAERVLSGPGLAALYSALSRLDEKPPEPAFDAADITRTALDGACPLCREALDMFFSMLGTIAANLALDLGARGGVYLAGGILPKIKDAFLTSGFRARFEDKGRFSSYLAAIPTTLIVHQTPAFVGLAKMVQHDNDATDICEMPPHRS
jgi:glucokinase